MPGCERGFLDLEDVEPRGWAMRRGHSRRLARETGRESQRGRAVFARSVNKSGIRWDRFEELRGKARCPAERKHKPAERSYKSARQRNSEKVLARESKDGPWEAVETLPWVSSRNDNEDYDIDFCMKVACPRRELDVETASTRTPDPQELEIEEEEEEKEEQQLQPPTLLRQRSAPSTQSEMRDAASATAREQRLPLTAWAALLGLRPGGNRRAEAEEAKQKQPPRWDPTGAKTREALGGSAATSSGRGAGKTKRQPLRHARPERDEKVAVVGQPVRPEEHAAVLRLVGQARATGRIPGWWQGRRQGLVALDRDMDEEYTVVEDYLTACLANRVVEVASVSRVQLPSPYKQWPGGTPTVMFHGCSTASNEESILRQGFQVSCCKSGGQNFGTWFAYDASYSNNGFAYQAPTGEKHLFICVVSDVDVRLDNATMRVVPQGCAYPQWLVRYTQQQTKRVALANGNSMWSMVAAGCWSVT